MKFLFWAQSFFMLTMVCLVLSEFIVPFPAEYVSVIRNISFLMGCITFLLLIKVNASWSRDKEELSKTKKLLCEERERIPGTISGTWM